MDKLTVDLLKAVSEYVDGGYTGAFNIRENGGCAGRQSTDNILIEGKKDGSGLDIYIKAGTKGEKVFIPACVTRGNVSDLVYNDFHVGAEADVTIIAGCGVHTDDDEKRRTTEYIDSIWKKAPMYFTKKNIWELERAAARKKSIR